MGYAPLDSFDKDAQKRRQDIYEARLNSLKQLKLEKPKKRNKEKYIYAVIMFVIYLIALVYLFFEQEWISFWLVMVTAALDYGVFILPKLKKTD